MVDFSKRGIRALSLLGPSGALSTAFENLAENSLNMVILTADLLHFSGLERFRKSFPDRIYNLGIAEQNMIAVAAGLAKEGFLPFVTTYSSFLASRCADQVRVNLSYMKLPVKMIGLTAGYGAGVLGATHMSLEDVALMRALPNIMVISPADCVEIVKTIEAVAETPNPTYIRLTGPMNTPMVYKEDYNFEIGRAIKLREGRDVCIIATGSMVYYSLQTAKLLEDEGISCSVVNMHTIKPLDQEAVLEANKEHNLLVVAEEHNVYGGLFSSIAEVLCQMDSHVPILPIGINDFYVHAGSYSYQMEESGLTGIKMKEVIIRRIKEISE